MAINSVDQSVFDKLGLSRPVEAKASDELGQNEFLKLMTTQLNNQDPTKPMEGADFFNQISQFTAVSGIQELQKTFSQVADAMFSGQALQASSLVGRNVMVESPTAQLKKDSVISGVVDLPSSADNLLVNIYSNAGELVKSFDMGAKQRGSVDFTWDGIMDNGSVSNPGQYIVKAEARYGRESFAQEVWVKERIDSITLGDGLQGLKLNMSGDKEITLAQVKKIL